jgi:hypothetical protein
MNALSTIEEMLRNPGTQVRLPDFVLALILSVISALLISILYQIFYENRATGSQIHRSFLLISPSITALFIAIQFSLPLSLGLVGALTIIRFRTPIKEPEEVGFIMLVIASAIVCATFSYLLLAILMGLAVVVLTGRKYFPRLFSSKRSDGVLLITLDGGSVGESKDSIMRVLDEKLVNGKLQSVSFTDSVTTLHYSFNSLTSGHLDGLEASLKEIVPIHKMNIFFNRQGALL